MTKENLLEGLRKAVGEPNANGYIGDTGVTARTLESYADSLSRTIKDDSLVDDAFYEAHAAVVRAMGGQMRKEYADFAKSYKPQAVETREAKDAGQQAQPQAVVSEMASQLKALAEQVARLQDGMKADRKAVSDRALRDGAIKKATELGVSNVNLWNDTANTVGITDGMGADAFEAATKRAYEAKLKAYLGDGATPYGGAGRQGSSGNPDLLKDFFAGKAAQGKFPKG